MKKEIRAVDDQNGLVRVTTTDERWYAKMTGDETTGLPTFKFLPSVTWILSVFPKLGLMKLRDEIGADEAELLEKLGGARGSKVHAVCSAIIEGREVRVDSRFDNGNGVEEELTADEVRHVMSFIEWVKKVKPKFVAWDQTIYSEEHGYAGTLDFIAEINFEAPGEEGGELYLVDIKTSKVIGTDYAMQVSSYKKPIATGEFIIDALAGRADLGAMKLAILQLGQPSLKTKPEEWRWKEVDDCFDLFLATKRIFDDVYETQIKDAKGCSQRDYPLILSKGRGEYENLVAPDAEVINAE